MPRPAMLLMSARTGEGVEPWIRWLRGVGCSRGAVAAGI
jgi:hypothetical protein